jgi:hypothetical protein
MQEKISLLEFGTELLAFEKVVEKNDSLLLAIKEEQAGFASLFPENSVYKDILKKAFILNDKNVGFEIQNIKDPTTLQTSIFISAAACPMLFEEYISRYNEHKHMGLTVKTKKNSGEEYCILFDHEGNIFLVVPSSTAKSEIYSFYSASNILLLDLPLILAGILFEPGVTKAKILLEELVAKNSVSTLANIYTYVKEHKEEILDLVPKIEALAKIINYAILREERKASENRKIAKTFRLAPTSVDIPYLVDKIEANPVLKLDSNSDKILSYRYQKAGSAFPVLLIPNATSVTSYFMGEKLFKKVFEGNEKNNFAAMLENPKGLLSLEEKIQELCEDEEKNEALSYNNLDKEIDWSKNEFFDIQSGYHNALGQFDWDLKNIRETTKVAKKNIKKELTENVALVISAFNEHLKKISEDNLLPLQEKLLASQKRTNKQCKRKIAELAKILAKIYRREILLANL